MMGAVLGTVGCVVASWPPPTRCHQHPSPQSRQTKHDSRPCQKSPGRQNCQAERLYLPKPTALAIHGKALPAASTNQVLRVLPSGFTRLKHSSPMASYMFPSQLPGHVAHSALPSPTPRLSATPDPETWSKLPCLPYAACRSSSHAPAPVLPPPFLFTSLPSLPNVLGFPINPPRSLGPYKTELLQDDLHIRPLQE